MSSTSQVTTEELAWAAGIVDGEGCIGLSKISKCHWSLRLSVGNTDIRMLDKLKALFNGTITLQNKKALHDKFSRDGYHRKPLWIWTVYGQKAEDILILLVPYLVVKHEQAEIGIKSRRYLAAKRYIRTNDPRYLEKIEYTEWLVRQLSYLKDNPVCPVQAK